jgi:hypothetical protein
MKSEKRSLPAFCRALLCAFVLVLPLASCNFLGLPEYELSVTIEPGLTGTPAAGVQVLADLTEVAYKYTPANPLHTVEVIVNGTQMAADSTITMYRDITMLARLVDIRATWNLVSIDASGTNSAFTVTFSGADILGGTFSDSRGHSGTWNAKSNVINLIYGDWESYKFTGTLLTMSGSWANGSATGTWNASRG